MARSKPSLGAGRGHWIGIVVLVLIGMALGMLLHDELLDLLPSGAAEREASESPKKDKKFIAVDSGIAAALGIETATASPADLATEIRAVGTVGFNDTKVARLAVRVTGTVRQVLKNIGDTVTAGEILAIIDSRDIADARSAYLAARDKLVLAERTLRRLTELLQGGGGAQKDVLNARREFNQAQIDLRNVTQTLLAMGQREADLERLEINRGDLGRYDVVAPFAGEVLEKRIFVGELLPQDREVFVIADFDVVWVSLRIAPELLREVGVGTPARISSTVGPSAEAEIAYVAPVITEETRSVRVRVDLENPEHRWRPGMAVDALIAGPPAPAAVTVPSDAIQVVEGKPSVFLPVPGGFRQQPVTLGRSNGKVTEILKGLSAGGKVASGQTMSLKSELEKGGDED
jgi:cobalt-zinc-cadmium efflux system membrane fusion protein